MKTGPYKEYFDNGKIMEEGLYLEDQKTGQWKDYDTAGTVVKKEVFKINKTK